MLFISYIFYSGGSYPRPKWRELATADLSNSNSIVFFITEI